VSLKAIVQDRPNSFVVLSQIIVPKIRGAEKQNFFDWAGIYGNEEISVYGQPGHGRAQARRGGDLCAGSREGAVNQHGDVLEVECLAPGHRYLG